MPKKYRQINKMIIDEISVVDVPAQEHAKISLLKRGDNAANSGGEQSVNKGDSLMTDEKKVADLEKRLDEMQKSLEDITAQRDEAIAKSALSDDERNFMSRLNDDAQKAFLKSDSEGRKKQMAKKSDSEILMEKARKEADELRKRISDLEEQRQEEAMQKRASDELPNMIGDLSVRAQLLKAAEKIGEDAVAVLKSADEAMKQLTVTKGTSADVSDDAHSYDGIKKRLIKDGMSQKDATYEAARQFSQKNGGL